MFIETQKAALTQHGEETLRTPNSPVGFPSPSREYLENSLDLNELMITNPHSTYFVRVEGYSMENARILPGDILVVDRAAKAVNNKIIIAALDGEMVVKRLKIKGDDYWLYPENYKLRPLKIEPWMDFTIWGVVCWVIHLCN